MSKINPLYSGKSKGRQRSIMSLALAASFVVLPAAIALACVPASSVGFDKQGYKYNAGETVTVTGRGFKASTPVTMKLQAPSGEQSTVGSAGKSTDTTGGFSDSFALTSDQANGDYVVSVTVGTGGARETFTVEPRASDAPPPPLAPVTPTEAPPAGNTGAENTAKRRAAVRSCQTTFRNDMRAFRKGAPRAATRMRNARRAIVRQRIVRNRAILRKKIVRTRNLCVREAQRRFP